ncbi:reactive oxygen species modulator 1 [Sipha flava]|uniref:Reactive oxygen species modulator 1 n=1 Tax=Sipha flava TaxID=143950 RepID=A0A8B8G4J0_9HEMI|nr:reactive oxygen species modulator 1 [Sipha flava]
MPVPSSSYYGGMQKPSCYDRVSNSFMMGATIGITIGMLFGGLGGLRSGFRGRELISKMGKTMLQSGGTFGTFMGVGAALRC